MPKIKKRKRSTDQATNLYNLTGAVSGNGLQADESLDDLMAELEGSASGVAAVSTEATVSALQAAAADDDSNIEPWDFSNDVIAVKNKDQSLTWNNALRIWIKNGKYSESLLPNFDVELARHFQVEKLSKFLLKSADDLKMPTFERWLIDSKLEEEKSIDPVLPNEVDLSTGASQRLLKELCQKLASSKAEQVVQDLCHQTATAIQDLTILNRRYANKSPLQKGDRIDMEDRNDGMKALLFTRKGWKKPYCIKLNVVHYNKLKVMFERVHEASSISNISNANSKATHAFHLIVMCLLLRYSSLSGGQLLNDLRGGGMQGAIQPHVFRTLQHEVFGEACVESFASPLNAYYPQFGSAFPDLDWHFGSVGDFFDKKFANDEGCYEANPPFSPGLMMKMATTMQNRLERADKKHKALIFVVIVPSANSSESPKTSTSLAKKFANRSFELLEQLSSEHFVLKSREHGYVEGAQHMKPTRYKQSPYDTSVFILQSRIAATKTNLAEAAEENIRTAFSSKHEEELQQRKELDSAGKSIA